MPKRKALGPVEGSDGEEDDYFSPPPFQPNFTKPIVLNFNQSPPKKAVGSSSSETLFGLGATQLPRFDQSPKPINFGNVTNIGVQSPKKAKSGEFSKSVKDLNNAFISVCRQSFSKNPSYSLIPLVKDYLHHTRKLMEQHRVDGTVELVNGINSHSKSFRSLGEFFEEFEQGYVNGDGFGDGSLTSNSSTSSPLSSASGTSERSTSLSGNSSPSKDFSKPFGSGSPNPLDANFALNAAPGYSASTLQKVLEGKKSFLSTTSYDTSPSLLKSGSIPSPLSNTPPRITPPETETTKPTAKAPFAGFSFFTNSSTTAPVLATASSSQSSIASTTSVNSEDKPTEDEDGEDDEPPKVEITPVTEDNSIYSIRCKVFGLIDGKCKDKGVGMLYIKKIDGGKHQLVVRADNNLGTVILNILLQKSLPLEKNSKNSVMTVDLQSKDAKGKPMPIFLKVKSESDATELFAKLKDIQQQSS